MKDVHVFLLYFNFPWIYRHISIYIHVYIHMCIHVYMHRYIHVYRYIYMKYVFVQWKIDAIIIYDFVFMHQNFWERHKIANGKQVLFFSIGIPCRPLQSWMENSFKGTDPQHKKLPGTFKGQFPFTEVARRKQWKGRILCAKTWALRATSQ